jgi:sugar phosphate isomerase/epimerase
LFYGSIVHKLFQNPMTSRRNFIKNASGIAGAFILGGFAKNTGWADQKAVVKVDAHLWVYASRFPPGWDCTPILDDVFSDLKWAGYDKIELMEAILRHEGSVQRLHDLVGKHGLPVTGTSYYGDMWDKTQQQHIAEDMELVLERLHAVGGTMIGLTVGDAKRTKTEDELDTQAETLQKIIALCKKWNVAPNLHNHTFEVINNLHDLNGTLKRVPELKLGPDLNWLVRAGVDPVWFIKQYGDRMVYMHLRDQRADGKWTEAVGEGVMDFPAIAAALKAIKYSGRAAVELAFDEPPKNTLREDWKWSRVYVKKVFGW